ncbi:hypothetical protein J1614_011144 [Plenodomus biglobosus]|nr:hypothetical protein J1614_011144 [Plenodomus biglobosus]
MDVWLHCQGLPPLGEDTTAKLPNLASALVTASYRARVQGISTTAMKITTPTCAHCFLAYSNSVTQANEARFTSVSVPRKSLWRPEILSDLRMEVYVASGRGTSAYLRARGSYLQIDPLGPSLTSNRSNLVLKADGRVHWQSAASPDERVRPIALLELIEVRHPNN